MVFQHLRAAAGAVAHPHGTGPDTAGDTSYYGIFRVHAIAEKEAEVGAETLREVEKSVMLQILDMHWKDHLAAMDHLRQGIHLRSYAQKNPTQEFKRESFNLFTMMLDSIKYEFIATLSKLEFNAQPDFNTQPTGPVLQYQHDELSTLSSAEQPEMPAQAMTEDEAAQPYVRQAPKVGRNDPCPCGSGKKYKQCCGKIS